MNIQALVASCCSPETPENGLIKVDGVLKVGRMAKFHCNPGFMMQGQPVMTCSEGTENGLHVGKWTGEVPSCVRACTYPGSVIGGKMVSEVKFYYSVGSSVKYECASGLTLSGVSRLECQENGLWSSAVPMCGKNMDAE